MIFSQKNQIVMALAPDADRYNGSPASDVISMKHYGHVCFVVLEGDGGVGTATITAEECTAADGTGATAIGFRYRLATTGDTWGTLTTVASSGYLTLAGANKMILIEIGADELSDGSPFVRLQLTEDDSTAVDAAIIAICSEARYGAAILPTAIV